MWNTVISIGQILIGYLFIVLLGETILKKENTTWYAFGSRNNELVGFRDSKGNIRLQAEYLAFGTPANKFDNIISVLKEENDQHKFFYLTKSGRAVAKDSVYSFDASFDCENEGFIRFECGSAGGIGILNREGNVVVPAEYNALTKVVNGMAVGLKGATKVYWDSEHQDGCNHFSWSGGELLLIDTNNSILVRDFKYTMNSIDFFSRIVTSEPINDSVRVSVRGVNGKYYSFVDFEKDFKDWLHVLLKSNFSYELAEEICFDNVMTYTKNQDWLRVSKSELVKRDYDFLKQQFEEIKKYSLDRIVEAETFNSYIFAHESFEQFFDNCSEHEDYKYPCMSVDIGKNTIERSNVNSFEFLRTKNGYKLICVWKSK